MKAIHSIDKDTIQGVCLALTKAYCHTDTDDLLNKDISVTFSFTEAVTVRPGCSGLPVPALTDQPVPEYCCWNTLPSQ